jgi:hypothetical protein
VTTPCSGTPVYVATRTHPHPHLTKSPHLRAARIPRPCPLPHTHPPYHTSTLAQVKGMVGRDFSAFPRSVSGFRGRPAPPYAPRTARSLPHYAEPAPPEPMAAPRAGLAEPLLSSCTRKMWRWGDSTSHAWPPGPSDSRDLLAAQQEQTSLFPVPLNLEGEGVSHHCWDKHSPGPKAKFALPLLPASREGSPSRAKVFGVAKGK